jgi:hypothetical protein
MTLTYGAYSDTLESENINKKRLMGTEESYQHTKSDGNFGLITQSKATLKVNRARGMRKVKPLN